MDVIDFLTCGGCQTEFPLSKITIFMEHKRSDCNVPTGATLSSAVSMSSSTTGYTFNNYACYTCPKKFGAAVSLLHHAQFQHQQKIFQMQTGIEGSSSEVTPVTAAEQEAGLPSNGTALKEFDHYYSTEVAEPFSKCCTAVVPKKRKSHYETKHRTSYFKAARLKRQQQPMPSSNIYINVDQSSLNIPECETDTENINVDGHPAFLPVGKTMTIPIASNRNYVGISYSDSLPNDRQNTNGNNSNVCNGEVTRSAVASNVLTAPNNTMDSTSTLAVKKKYPTSKPFKCDHCDESFNQRIHLKKHLSKHTGVKPYKCSECEYATVERSHLKVHIRIHTGEKPFKCNHCEYSTAQNSTLKIHLKRHHSGLVSLECTHCGKQFPEKTQLLWHQQEHGQIDSTPASNQLPALSYTSTNTDVNPGDVQAPPSL